MTPEPRPVVGAVPVKWVSGEILTFLNKVVFPAIWLAFVLGVPAWVLVTVGRIRIASGWGLFCTFVVAATAWMMWVTAHLQRVGYRGRELVISNYLRQETVPFHNVASVEGVWWYWRRLVSIRFRERTSFGGLVYYIPKWAAARALLTAPEEELQRIIRGE